jgi:hypothetical protein
MRLEHGLVIPPSFCPLQAVGDQRSFRLEVSQSRTLLTAGGGKWIRGFVQYTMHVLRCQDDGSRLTRDAEHQRPRSIVVSETLHTPDCVAIEIQALSQPHHRRPPDDRPLGDGGGDDPSEETQGVTGGGLGQHGLRVLNERHSCSDGCHHHLVGFVPVLAVP